MHCHIDMITNGMTFDKPVSGTGRTSSLCLFRTPVPDLVTSLVLRHRSCYLVLSLVNVDCGAFSAYHYQLGAVETKRHALSHYSVMCTYLDGAFSVHITVI